MNNIYLVVAVVGGLIFLAHLFLHIFNRTRIPDVLLLIIVGIILGPVSQVVSVEAFGLVGPIFVTITLVVILFEGGIALKLSALKSALSKAVKLAVANFFMTMVVVGIVVHSILSLEWIPSLIVGAIAASTSEAIIIPMIKQLRTSESMNALLSVESSVNDVLSVAVALALIGAYQLGNIDIGLIAGDLIASFLVAIIFGFGGAFLWSLILRRIHAMKNTMFTTVAIVFALYGLVEMFGFSGAIAALAFGITIGNIESIKLPRLGKPLADKKPAGLTDTERAFFTESSFLLKTFFFIYLGISLQFSSTGVILVGILITFIAFALRIPAVKIAVGKSVSTREATLMSVMIPKGLAAAVLAAIPAQQGIAGGILIRDVTYMVILISIVVTSIIIPLLEKPRFAEFYQSIVSGHFTGMKKAMSVGISPPHSEGSITALKGSEKITPLGDKTFGDRKDDWSQ
ncbi:MAG: cation:proton antiporter [Dehalococcoidales bacterium]